MGRSPLVWFSDEGSVVVNGQLLSTRVTDFKMSGGTRDAETRRTFGRGAFQIEKPMENFEVSITSLVSGLEFAQHVFGAGSTTTTGQILSGDGVRSKLNVVYTVADPTVSSNPASARFRFTSGFATQVEFTQAVDGALEQTFTFKSLPGNTFWEYSSGAALVLPAV